MNFFFFFKMEATAEVPSDSTCNNAVISERAGEVVIAKNMENVSEIVRPAVANAPENANVSKNVGDAVLNLSGNADARQTVVLGRDVSGASAGGLPLFGFDKGLDAIPAFAPRIRESTQFQFGGGSGPRQPIDQSPLRRSTGGPSLALDYVVQSSGESLGRGNPKARHDASTYRQVRSSSLGRGRSKERDAVALTRRTKSPSIGERGDSASSSTSVSPPIPKQNLSDPKEDASRMDSNEDMRGVVFDQDQGAGLALTELITKFERDITAGLNQLHEREIPAQAKSNCARDVMKYMRKVVWSIQKACFSKKKPSASVSAITSAATSNQSQDSEAPPVDVRPSKAIRSFAAVLTAEAPLVDARPSKARSSTAAVTAPSSVQQRQSNVAPSAPGGPLGLRGEIVCVNHTSKFAFIRTTHHTNDFHVGRQQYHPEMKVGNAVSFECEFVSRPSRNQCPEAFSVKPIRGMTQQAKSANHSHARNKSKVNKGTVGLPAQAVQPQPSGKSFSEAQRSELTEIIRNLMARQVTGTASLQA